MKYVQSFLVKGKGHFPLDMLRYDHCWPSTSDDAAEMGWHPPGRLGTLNAETDREVRLTRHVDLKSNEPTHKRWASFGWTVIEASVQTYK